MKNLVILNYNEFDEQLLGVLKDQFTVNREVWNFFHEAFWPENREKSVERFYSLSNGDNIICQTVFDGFQQLELVAAVLIKLMTQEKKINFYVINPDLKTRILEYLYQNRSDIEDSDISYEESKRFKNEMNNMVCIALNYHNVYNLKRNKKKLIKITENEKRNPDKFQDAGFTEGWEPM